MQWNRKHVLIGAAWWASLVLANYVGGVIGFRQGYKAALGLKGAEAMATTVELRALRRGSVAEVINILETRLDTDIASYVDSNVAKTYRSPYNLWLRLTFGNMPMEVDAAALAQVLKYREEFPPVVGSEAMKAKLMSVLQAYRNAPAPSFVKKQ
jgi:hypothetical protein